MNVSPTNTLYAVDAVALKVDIESNLRLLKLIHEDCELDAYSSMHLTDVIASQEQQIAQLDEAIRLNKIL